MVTFILHLCLWKDSSVSMVTLTYSNGALAVRLGWRGHQDKVEVQATLW